MEKKYRKAPFILIGLAAWFLIVKCSTNEFFWDLSSQNIFDQKTISKAEGKTSLPALMQNIENGEIDDFFAAVSNNSDEYPEAVMFYFTKFYDYINSDKKHQDITYLLNNMPVIKNYCLDCNFTEPDAIMYSEYIPFYCIKKYEIKKNKHNSGRMYDICTTYLKNTTTNHISEKSAVIICLQIRSFYRKDGVLKESDYINDVENMITTYQQQYPMELGSIPKYIDEAAYLNRFKNLCSNIIKGLGRFHLGDKWARITFDDKISKLED